MSETTYEIFAIKYATRPAKRSSHFIDGDPHDGPMPMDYFVWVIRNRDRMILVDTGFSAEVAAQRKRQHLRTPAAGLGLLGIDAKSSVLLLLSLIVASLSLGTGRTTLMQGTVHLVIFAVYLFTAVVP